MDYLPISRLVRVIEDSTWHFAKTMPGIPHSYVRKRETAYPQDVIGLCEYCHRFGQDETFGKRTYRYLHLEDHKYWSMDADCKDTILINRAKKELEGYDLIPDFVDMFTDPEHQDEDYQTIEFLASWGALSGKVLDIGCGAGFLADKSRIAPKNYLGIDPSLVQLKAFASRHPDFDSRLICTRLEEFVARHSDGLFNSIVATYGSANYAYIGAVMRSKLLLAPGGVLVAMFFGEDYEPATHEKAKVEVPFISHSADFLESNFDQVIDFGNYQMAIYNG